LFLFSDALKSRITIESRSKYSPCPPPIKGQTNDIVTTIIDAGAALISRQFDRDLNAVVRRAR
jgi:hypothetical protein